MENKSQKENIIPKGRIRIITTKAGTREVRRASDWYSNLIMLGVNTGKTLILQRLVSINTFSLNLTHADLGTGTNSPATNNTALQTPIARAAVAIGSVSGNVATLQFFFSNAVLANGTYTEFGSFVDGTSSVSTGKIFNRALFGVPYAKGSGEDTTIELQVTIT
jgi:hypothetical protein